jgi:hypothetical protein
MFASKCRTSLRRRRSRRIAPVAERRAWCCVATPTKRRLELARSTTDLGVRAADVFPVHFRCTVPVNGLYVTGIIESDDLTGAA